MPQLIEPSPALHASWLAAEAEWEALGTQDGAGRHLVPDQGLETAEGFRRWTEALREQETNPLGGYVPATHRWIVEGGTFLGAIDLRHRLNGFLFEAGGHVGYSVRPSARGRGVATWALGEMLEEARARGIGQVLITCDEDNEASARVAEHHGAVLEDVRDTVLGRKCRFWITLDD
ncbi:Acetyltransferase (GNAT) family protein [Streptomyces sp. ADI96-15]|uniref:GNAT family N-acetyltransferase n=1 Tax=unclassified Streptomyces TaxID=2593676 RepID=UPI0003C2CDD4|nr:MULTISPECIES: GNAT family N-acetyltransferase [unclassified Streptomyces]ESP98076.1 GCN5-related N-acetyltransferase [Streptomyces sp. GBA 94-10 4N24]ESQ03693.1 GCN5-related N-acetyltransferase [Streptomyces sp. PVA_94-07]RPK75241.1 Acetyltransferase (GNAT) family protein [Streptomyces sp. ADI96-15]UZN60179.1 GCN5-related N-acetyltransferase [Streptomyces sp. GBA 94-10 4N24]